MARGDGGCRPATCCGSSSVPTHAAVTAARGEAVATAAAQLAAKASRGLFAARITTAVALVIAWGRAARRRPCLPSGPIAVPTRAGAGRGRAIAATQQVQAEARAPIDPDDPATADLFAGKVVDIDGKPLDGAKTLPHAREPGSDAPGRSPCGHGAMAACSGSRRKT